ETGVDITTGQAERLERLRPDALEVGSDRFRNLGPVTSRLHAADVVELERSEPCDPHVRHGELCGWPGALEHVPCAHILFERELRLQALPPAATQHDTRSGSFQGFAESLEGVDPVLQILF